MLAAVMIYTYKLIFNHLQDKHIRSFCHKSEAFPSKVVNNYLFVKFTRKSLSVTTPSHTREYNTLFK
jgi:hypothetical protein